MECNPKADMKAQALEKRLRHFWREWLKPLLTALLIVSAVRSTLADWNDVPTGSMKPTILEGDRIFVNKLAYDFKVPFTTRHLGTWADPARGDIVVFFSPKDGQRLVKRVVGLPGDRLEMVNNQVWVNGEAIHYKPIDTERLNAHDPEYPAPHSFFTEEMAGKPHPIMIKPGLPSRRSFSTLQVPENHFFMMGDNRDDSFDSRYFGCVARERIIGRAIAVVGSVDLHHHWLPRWQRFLSTLH